uniref:Uncharacterized protein n=1 Tax=Anguilla anguilla TaxID=7936 RepID=A0A0E9PV23_ANGAN
MMMTAVHEKSGLCRILFQLGACWKTVLLPGQCSVKKGPHNTAAPLEEFTAGCCHDTVLPNYKCVQVSDPRDFTRQDTSNVL